MKFPLPPAKVQAYADSNGFAPVTACTPPAENSAPSGASEVKDGQGVCTLSNVDKTGLLHVRKGVIVDLDGFTLSVLRVRRGLAYCETWVTRVPMTALCSQVRVVHR